MLLFCRTACAFMRVCVRACAYALVRVRVCMHAFPACVYLSALFVFACVCPRAHAIVFHVHSFVCQGVGLCIYPVRVCPMCLWVPALRVCLSFIIARLGDDLFMIDQHATDEKYMFETLQKSTTIHSQPLIWWVTPLLAAVPLSSTPLPVTFLVFIRSFSCLDSLTVCIHSACLNCLISGRIYPLRPLPVSVLHPLLGCGKSFGSCFAHVFFLSLALLLSTFPFLPCMCCLPLRSAACLFFGCCSEEVSRHACECF